METGLAWILLALLGLLLLAAAALDLRHRTIPNRLNLAIAIGAIPFWWATGVEPWPGMALQIGVAALVFALFAAAFALGAMGGGDVKMIAALALWVPARAIPDLLMIMALAGGALSLVMLARRRLARAEGPVEVPYGVAIASAGIWLISEPFLNQFG